MSRPFVPQDFMVPKGLQTDKYKLRMLKVTDVVKDYDAVMTSADQLQGIFGPRFKWPAKDLSLEQDLIDLGWHQKEFQMRSSFAYTVMSLDESRCLGCVYIFPSRKEGFDAEVYMWLRKSELDKGLDPLFYKKIKKWIAENWPFKKVAYPGREIDWSKWSSLK